MCVEEYFFDVKSVLTEAQPLLDEGLSCWDMVVYLQQRGIGLIESIDVIRHLYRIDNTSAKKIVFSHPIWEVSANMAIGLHDEIIEELKAQGKLVEKTDMSFTKRNCSHCYNLVQFGLNHSPVASLS